MSESAEKPCDSLALLGDYDSDEKEASPEASEPAHMETDEKTDIEVARASSAEADSEQPGSPVSVLDHSSILLDEKKSDDESKIKSIGREDEPMETSSAYRGGPHLSKNLSDDIRKSSVDRKQSQSPKQKLEYQATIAIDINSKVGNLKTMDETVGMDYEKVKSESPEESLDCDYGEKPKSSPSDQPTSPKIDEQTECDSAEQPVKPSSSEPVVQKKPINPENFDDLLVMPGEDSSSPKQLDDSSVDMPKSHESSKSPEQGSSSPSLSDMPIYIIELIIERSKYKEQLILRKVSKSLRALVDKLKPACESICLKYYYKDSITIVFGKQYVTYSKDVIDFQTGDISVVRDDFENTALDDLAATLKNPRLQLEEFRVEYEDDVTVYNQQYNKMLNILKSLDHQVSVQKAEIECANSSGLLSILPYLKPGVLKTISLVDINREGDDWRENSTVMDQIARLEQWKRAEELEFDIPFDEFLIRYATHFKRFRLEESDLDDELLMLILEYLSQLKYFEHCTLWIINLPDDNLFHQVLGAPVSSNTTEEVFHHPIANSNYYFELKTAKDTEEESFVEIEKKKR